LARDAGREFASGSCSSRCQSAPAHAAGEASAAHDAKQLEIEKKDGIITSLKEFSSMNGTHTCRLWLLIDEAISTSLSPYLHAALWREKNNQCASNRRPCKAAPKTPQIGSAREAVELTRHGNLLLQRCFQ
jgi:hypothetical protein